VTKLPRLSPGLAILSLLLVALTYIVNAMDRIVFPTLLPAVAGEYGFPIAEGGFLATVFTLGLGIAGIPGGFLFDRMSRKMVAVLGIVVYSLCTILTCLSFGFTDMALYRTVSGIGEALQNAAIFTMAGAYFSQNRTLAFGVLNVAYGIGSFIGPRWGAALLAAYASWRAPLYIYGALGLVGAAVTLILVSRRYSEQLPPTVARDLNAEVHIPDRLLNRNTMMLAAASIGGGLAGFGYLGLYPTFLRTELHFTIPQAAAAASMYGVGALMGLVCGYLGDRINQKYITIATLAALAVVGYCIFNVATTPFWQNVLSALEGTASSGFLYVNNYSLMQRSVRSTIAGRASGLVVTCVYLPAAISGYLFALLETRFGWGNAALLQMSILLIIPIVIMLFFDVSQTSCPIRPPAAIGAEKFAND
jgi:MFS family permease